MGDIESLYKKFGFSEPPFNQTTDTNFMFKSKQHMAAFYHLKYGLIRDGFTLLIGDNGMGKTLLCQQILSTAGKDIKTVHIYNTCFSTLDILKMVYYDLTGTQLDGNSSGHCLHEINKLLIRLTGEGKRVVIIVDEAQRLKPSLLEGLRQLSNCKTEKRKLLSFILIGQPQLETRLANFSMRQLEQRISVKYFLKPFKISETIEYIYFRLRLSTTDAVADLSYCFTTPAVCLVHWYSKGIPRRINQICDRALLASFNSGKKKIRAIALIRAAREIVGTKLPGKNKTFRNKSFIRVAAVVTVCSIAIYIGLEMYQNRLNEKNALLGSNQGYIDTGLTRVVKTSDEQAVIDESTQFSTKEKQGYKVYMKSTEESNTLQPDSAGRVEALQVKLNPDFSHVKSDWNVSIEDLSEGQKSAGLTHSDKFSGLHQNPSVTLPIEKVQN
ncbi:MAG: AAA family ATPase [Candidatus Scalindua rubra]|uniref:General secretion pathway protein A (ExeA) n=1 Tax=Candidatus Scalindua brodae TaxID=237368 RepID=A0A0B0ER90_9BACT|nr:MAG: general secretion pathway protein A (exeA) [Candidatus Scalindua brodae]MBZ0108680.1 AAA family ATPase [Candidatus Scalindua rubra]TWU37956.1 Archaeal ATPase [Candidatus Brocadiaceae bacterium S225]